MKKQALHIALTTLFASLGTANAAITSSINLVSPPVAAIFNIESVPNHSPIATRILLACDNGTAGRHKTADGRVMYCDPGPNIEKYFGKLPATTSGTELLGTNLGVTQATTSKKSIAGSVTKPPDQQHK
jgi:hypothetical protein